MLNYLAKSNANTINESDKNDSKVDDENVLVDDEQLVNHFGKLYATHPVKFRFESGDRIFIKELVELVKSAVDEKGINTGLRKFKSDQKKKTILKTNHTAKSKPSLSLSNVNIESLKSELHTRVISCMKSHRADQLFDIDLEREITEDTVDIGFDNGVMVGIVHCVICRKIKKKGKNKPKRVHYSSGSDWPCWSIANFATHLKKLHKMQFNGDPSKIELDKNKEQIDDSQTNVDHSIKCVDDVVTVTMPAEIAETTSVIYNQLSNQIKLMMSAVLNNSEPQEIINFTLIDDTSKSLNVAKISPDGDCLFGAMSHQLEPKRINSKSHKTATTKLRLDAVNYILDEKNFPRFAYQLRDSVYEWKKKEEIQDMDLECKLFVRLRLAKPGIWGGAESIKAVSELKEVNVILINECGPCYSLSNVNVNNSRSICIAYRLPRNCEGNIMNDLERNHYDSVCDMDSAALYDAAQIIASQKK